MSDVAKSYFPPPDSLPAFPDAQRSRGKTPKKGGGVRKRWKDRKNRKVYEWDYQHGKVERWNWKGNRHEGEYDPDTGVQTKPPDPTKHPITPTMREK